MSKAKIMLIASGLTLIAIIYIAYSVLKRQTSQPVSQSLHQPTIPQFFKGKTEIVSNLKADDFKFPTSLPLIRTRKDVEITDTDIQKIATNLNFTSQPKIITDVVYGKTYIYSNNQMSLVVYAKTGTINYSLNENNNVINKNLSDKDIIRTAQEFLEKEMLVSNQQLEFSSFVYLRTNDEGIDVVSKQNAEFIQVNFDPKDTDIAVTTLDPISSPNFVWVKTDASIFKAQVTRLGTLTKTEEKYKLKTFDEVNSSLSTAKIVTLDNGNINLSTLPIDTITKTTITGISLAYLANTNSDLYQPIFILKGKSILKGLTGEVDSVYYLPALAN